MKFYLGWIVKGCDVISKKFCKSFWVCGIGIPNDGSENDEIHCLGVEKYKLTSHLKRTSQ